MLRRSRLGRSSKNADSELLMPIITALGCQYPSLMCCCKRDTDPRSFDYDHWYAGI